jgi:hypothetical protein
LRTSSGYPTAEVNVSADHAFAIAKPIDVNAQGAGLLCDLHAASPRRAHGNYDHKHHQRESVRAVAKYKQRRILSGQLRAGSRVVGLIGQNLLYFLNGYRSDYGLRPGSRFPRWDDGKRYATARNRDPELVHEFCDVITHKTVWFIHLHARHSVEKA